MRAARKLRNQANQVCSATNLQKYSCYRFLLRPDSSRNQAILQWIHENGQKPPYNGILLLMRARKKWLNSNGVADFLFFFYAFPYRGQYSMTFHYILILRQKNTENKDVKDEWTSNWQLPCLSQFLEHFALLFPLVAAACVK